MKTEQKGDGTFLTCKRCGHCCTLVPLLSLWEQIRIMVRGNLNFTEKDVKGRRCLKVINGDCVFLERDKGKTKCRIYDIRPQVCRNFPYKGATECNVDKKTFKERICN